MDAYLEGWESAEHGAGVWNDFYRVVQVLKVLKLVNVVPYIQVTNAKRTIEKYKELFGATLVDRMPFDPSIGAQFGFPEDFDYESSTMHAVMEIGGGMIYLSDSMGPAASGGSVEIVLDLDSREQIEDIWGKVKSQGLTVKMELEEQFWGALYGRFVDDDGIGWQLNLNLTHES
jgi:PhnB protein